jgi:ATP-dependent DNA helicase RecG
MHGFFLAVGASRTLAYPPFHPKFEGQGRLAMSRAEFDRAFPDESDYVERKSGTGQKPLQESAVAFSNADGGLVLIGVQDDGEIVGRELTPGTADDVHRAMRTIHDPGAYEIHPLVVGDRSITVLSIRRRAEGFAQTSDGRVLVRRGRHNISLIGADLRRFINERTFHRFEETAVDAALSRARKKLLASITEAFDWSDTGEIRERLRGAGLAEDGHMTVAGALYLLQDPAEKLGKAFVEVFRYPDDESDYDRREEIRGPLHVQLQETVRFVAGELGEELVVLGVHRHSIPRLPIVVLREAVANALAHRSYEISGSPVRVELRPGAVKVISPGGLPEPVTVQNLRDTQSARNHHVITVLRRLGLAEDAGRGIDVMQDSMRQELLDPPEFEDTGHSVEVSLPIRSAVAPAERAWVREMEDRGVIEPTDRILLVHAARGERLTNGRVRELLGVDSSEARVDLHRLRDAGFLRQHGMRGGATYTLKQSLAPPAGLRLSESALKDLIVSMANEGPVTNHAVRLRTGLDRVEALGLLSDLVDEGRLVRLGERRGARYELPGS